MFIKVLFLVQIVESRFSFPSCLIVLLFFEGCVLLIHSWESQRKEIFSICVKVSFIVGDMFAKLLLLKLPNIQLLTRVLKDINVGG